MISDVGSFSHYFASIRRRTLNYIDRLPAERIDWRPSADELSCGDLLRHLSAAELMFVGAVVNGKWHYSGHEAHPDDDLASLRARLEASHNHVLEQLVACPDSLLKTPRPTLDGPPVKAWRLLMAMVEHEVHHRSQLASYLSLMAVEPPQIYGLGVEDVIAKASP